MSSQNIPSVFGRADQLIEPPNLAPLVCRSDGSTSQPDFSIHVPYPLDIRMSCVGGAVEVDKARDTVVDRTCGILIKWRPFVFNYVDAASERTRAWTTLQEIRGNGTFRVYPVSPVPCLHGASANPAFVGHHLDQVIFNGWTRADIACSFQSRQQMSPVPLLIGRPPRLNTKGGGGCEIARQHRKSEEIE